MKNVKILGSGCALCETLRKQVEQVLQEKQITYNLEKVTDFQKIAQYGVMKTPGLVIDEKVIVSGRLPSLEELKEIL